MRNDIPNELNLMRVTERKESPEELNDHEVVSNVDKECNQSRDEDADM